MRLLAAAGVAMLPVAGHAQSSPSFAGAALPAADMPPVRAGAAVPSLAAVIEAMPKNLPRARGPSLAESVAAAQAAAQACMAKGAKVSVLIADAVGEPVVLLSGDGAGVRSGLIARSKVAAVVRFGLPSGEAEIRGKADPSIVAAAAADPNIGVLRSGGFPVLRDGTRIAIVGVSGALGMVGQDEACAQVAVQRLTRPGGRP